MAQASKYNTQSAEPMPNLLLEVTTLLLQESLVMTAKKDPQRRNIHANMVLPRTTEKFKPLTLAEMRADIEAIKGPSSKKPNAPPSTSVVKRKWNSSIKVDRKISHTSNGQFKNNPVRKVLCFQSNSQVNTRATTFNNETPKFPKPQARPKKYLHPLQEKNPVRVSGVFNIPETPIDTIKQKPRPTMANKENISNFNYKPKVQHINREIYKIVPTPKPLLPRKSIAPQIPDTPSSNDSWKSSSDSSFLQKEKEIRDGDNKMEYISKETSLRIEDVSPPISTPFMEYRTVQDYFNNSSDIDNSINDNTIMCFDNPSTKSEAENVKEDNVIVSLCDLFNKASVTNNEQIKSELEILIEIKKETENNIKSQIKLLKYLNRLIQKKQEGSNSPINFDDKINSDLPKMISSVTPEKCPILCHRVSVIRSTSKSPSYKVPKRGSCLRKNLIYRSMPEMSSGILSHVTKMDARDKAMTMYMKMKEEVIFLNTPKVKTAPAKVPDTPALTSQNLQMQLDKLFNNS